MEFSSPCSEPIPVKAILGFFEKEPVSKPSAIAKKVSAMSSFISFAIILTLSSMRLK
jgi:hypothetical protein